MRTLWLTILLFMMLVPVQAQGLDAAPLAIDTMVAGELNDATPRVVYQLQGTRGTVVRFSLQASSGNLDPVLRVFKADGEVLFSRDDYAGTPNIETNLTFEDNALYYVVVGRFAYNLGSSAGTYELRVERVGVLSESGTRLQYGIPVSNTISNRQAQIYYTFQANQGDILNIEMVRVSGGLDPALQVVDANRFLLAENDDFDSTTKNATIDNLLIAETGTYIVIATRYGEAAGESVGGFVLLISEAGHSGLGNSSRAPAPLPFGQSVENEITERRYEFFYSFQAQEHQLVTVTMERLSQAGLLDAYLIITDSDFNPLIEDDDSGAGKNARIARYRVPANGIYYVLATRFDRANGTTRGAFRLTLQSAGFAFDTVSTDIPRLLYGTQVPDSISNDDSESFFVFWGTINERVSIRMNRSDGDLDPILELFDAEQERILRDDDSGNNQNALIENYTLPYTGVYYIRATRYEGNAKATNTTGRYVLVLSLEG